MLADKPSECETSFFELLTCDAFIRIIVLELLVAATQVDRRLTVRCSRWPTASAFVLKQYGCYGHRGKYTDYQVCMIDNLCQIRDSVDQ